MSVSPIVTCFVSMSLCRNVRSLTLFNVKYDVTFAEAKKGESAESEKEIEWVRKRERTSRFNFVPFYRLFASSASIFVRPRAPVVSSLCLYLSILVIPCCLSSSSSPPPHCCQDDWWWTTDASHTTSFGWQWCFRQSKGRNSCATFQSTR